MISWFYRRTVNSVNLLIHLMVQKINIYFQSVSKRGGWVILQKILRKKHPNLVRQMLLLLGSFGLGWLNFVFEWRTFYSDWFLFNQVRWGHGGNNIDPSWIFFSWKSRDQQSTLNILRRRTTTIINTKPMSGIVKLKITTWRLKNHFCNIFLLI